MNKVNISGGKFQNSLYFEPPCYRITSESQIREKLRLYGQGQIYGSVPGFYPEDAIGLLES